MGELMRRYWVPALLSWEIGEPDSPPVIIKLLGEELVAFRDTDGKVGVVGARCAHRRAHMFWGRNEECGLRCVYHGWKFDTNGACVDMPSEPAESNFKDKVRIPAYPTYEVGGLIYAYMGPPEKQPPPPLFDWVMVPAENRGLSKVLQMSNWLQGLEGGIDNVHSTFLHGGKPPGIQYDPRDPRNRGRNVSKAPRIEVVPTDYGYSYGSTLDMGAEGTDHVRGYHWVMPWNQIRATGGNSGHMWVPMDDENTMTYNWSVRYDETQNNYDPPASEGGRGGPRAEPTPEQGGPDAVWFQYGARLPMGGANGFGEAVDPENNFLCNRNMYNKYLIDREDQRLRTYTGIGGGANVQDRAIQESMGAIADRTLERLGTTDRAIINARRALLTAIKTVQDGGDPPGVGTSYYGCHAYEMVVPSGTHWWDALKPHLYQEPLANSMTKA
jgi:phenylpropionate dioxygenase-like ring-hydroxylating dioxygenase large terminal subunit